MNLDERNEKIEEYERGCDLLTTVLAEIPRQAWNFKPAPDEWSVHEVVIHMADSESMGATRARKLIAEPGSALMPYEDAIWALELNYQNQNVEDALELFRLTRRTTYHVLKAAPESAFAHVVMPPGAVHPEYGEDYTLDKWLNIYTAHVLEHIQQLQNIFRAWQAKNK